MLTGRQSHLCRHGLGLCGVLQGIDLPVDTQRDLIGIKLAACSLYAQGVRAIHGCCHLIGKPVPFLTGFVELTAGIGIQALHGRLVHLLRQQVGGRTTQGIGVLLYGGAEQKLFGIHCRDDHRSKLRLHLRCRGLGNRQCAIDCYTSYVTPEVIVPNIVCDIRLGGRHGHKHDHRMLTGRQSHLCRHSLCLCGVLQGIDLPIDTQRDLIGSILAACGFHTQSVGTVGRSRDLIGKPVPFLAGLIELISRIGKQGLDSRLVCANGRLIRTAHKVFRYIYIEGSTVQDLLRINSGNHGVRLLSLCRTDHAERRCIDHQYQRQKCGKYSA